MFRYGKSHELAAMALLFMIVVASSCSEKITSAEEQRIDLEIRTSLEASGQVAQASTFVLTVTGLGIMEPIVAKLALSNGLLIGSVVVPAGPDRVFRIDAFDEAGTLIYSGQSTADVLPGSELKLDIELVPRVPLIKVSPMYLETLQGDFLAMKVLVYNLGDISSIDLNLVDYRVEGNSYIGPTSVVVNPEIAKVAGYAITTEEDHSTTVRFTLRTMDSDLVDENGYAELVTFYYQTNMYEVSPYETAVFTPSALLMIDKLGNELPTGQIHAESSVVRLYDYWARYRAYWDMSGGDDPTIIFDDSQHGLDGTATGTSVITGYYGFGEARFFNGSGDYIEVPDNDLLDIRDEITISMWVYAAVGAAPNPLSSLICKRTKDGPVNYQLLLDEESSPEGYKSLLFRYGSSVYHTYRVDVPDDRTTGWFHVLFSYRFGEPSSAMMVIGYGCRVYEMPGEWIVGDGREPAPNTSGVLTMGRDNASTTNYFFGGLDEVELFDIVWTPGVVQYYLFTGCR
ncbi:MAG: hypothetical protein NTW97_05035 [Candidatus Krumholzibacteria bacterium]|nr:hypothetical protein [Candidatus Krumholzibacteria bacterium]